MIVPEKCGKSTTFVTGRFRELLDIYSIHYEEDGFNPPWTGYFVVRRDRVVGSCGFIGKPKNGEVEIAFWTFSRHQGEGVATEACRQMVDIVSKADSSTVIIATTASDRDASAKVLEKNGFVIKGVASNENVLWKLVRPMEYGVYDEF